MNGWDILLLALLALALILALRRTLRTRGSCSCGGNCAGCGGNCGCCEKQSFPARRKKKP